MRAAVQITVFRWGCEGVSEGGWTGDEQGKGRDGRDDAEREVLYGCRWMITMTGCWGLKFGGAVGGAQDVSCFRQTRGSEAVGEEDRW